MIQPLYSVQLDEIHRLEIVQGDLTREDVDAIVNAANERLAHGGGVAAAIVQRGGNSIQVESFAWVRQHGRVTHANPAYTQAGNLACRYVIHAVGPIWGEDDEEGKLREAIRGSLQLADELHLHSIAFPAISCGIFGFPVDLAAETFLNEIPQYFQDDPASGLALVRLTLYDSDTVAVFGKAFERIFQR